MLHFRKNSILLLAVFLMSTITFAQSKESNKRDHDISLYIESNKGSFNVNESDEKAKLINNVNTILIEQIGVDNTINAVTNTQSSDIVLNQFGDFNKAMLDITAKTTASTIDQNGNNNYFGEYANAPKLNLERAVNQQGNSNQVIIYGSNSITEKLQINLTGNAESVTIRNFN